MDRIQFNRFILFCFLMVGFSQWANANILTPKVDSIQIVFDKHHLILPNETFPIGVVSYFRNGKVKKTVGLAGGNVWWWRYKVDVSGGTFSSGDVWVNDKLVPSMGKYIGLKVCPRKQPELVKELLLPLNYETKIEYRPIPGFDKAPGSQIMGELFTEFNDGSQRICKDLRDGPESGFFRFSGNGGTWKNGKFIIDTDFTRINHHCPSLIINSLRNKSVADTFSVQLDYKRTYNLRFWGSSGMPGFSGSDGSSGSSGCHGGDGQIGQNGEFGGDGPEIGLWADLYRDSLLNCDLLYVYGQNRSTREEFRYLINPDGGKLVVSSVGGFGGNGGNGGNGGSGGAGADGQTWIEKHLEKRIIKKPVVKKSIRKEKQKRVDASGKEYEVEVDVEVTETVYVDEEVEVEVEVVKQGPGGDGGNGGDGGPGGLGGPGGYGGDITLYFTEDAMPYKYLIVPRSEGGSGGMHGSGGFGGTGGRGGSGNPSGSSGSTGQSGPSMIGWADNGGSGRIRILPTEEFFQYKVSEKE